MGKTQWFIVQQKCHLTAEHWELGLVPKEGVEPPTHALRMRCSTN